MKKLMFSMFLCFVCSDSYADVSTGLVGWWKFDEAVSGACGAAPNILDASGSVNTGTCHGNPTWGAGHIGRGTGIFVAASDQYVQTASATNIPKINASQTLSAWVNIPSTAAVYDIMAPELSGSGANQLRISGGDAQVSQWGGATTATATQNFTPTAIYIGSYGAGEYFGGDIDDARIYNRVLSAADVAQLFTFTGRNGLFTFIDR